MANKRRVYIKDMNRTSVFLPAEEHAEAAALARRLNITQSEVFRLGVRLAKAASPDAVARHLEPADRGRRRQIKETTP